MLWVNSNSFFIRSESLDLDSARRPRNSLVLDTDTIFGILPSHTINLFIEA